VTATLTETAIVSAGVLLGGGGLVFLAAGLLGRLCANAQWQRSCWRGGVVGLWLLLILEISGLSWLVAWTLSSKLSGEDQLRSASQWGPTIEETPGFRAAPNAHSAANSASRGPELPRMSLKSESGHLWVDSWEPNPPYARSEAGFDGFFLRAGTVGAESRQAEVWETLAGKISRRSSSTLGGGEIPPRASSDLKPALPGAVPLVKDPGLGTLFGNEVISFDSESGSNVSSQGTEQPKLPQAPEAMELASTNGLSIAEDPSAFAEPLNSRAKKAIGLFDIGMWVALWVGRIWLFGVGVCLAWLTLGRVILAIVRRKAVEGCSAELRLQVSQIAREVGLKRPVRVLISSWLEVPAAFGLRYPTLIIPQSFEKQFRTEQCQAILVHELAHLAAGDPWWQMLARFAAAFQWWNPFAWLLGVYLRKSSELAADEAVTALPNGPILLADILLRYGRECRRLWLAPAGMALSLGHNRSFFARRVKRLVALAKRGSTPQKLSGVRRLVALALIGTLAVGSVGCVGGVRVKWLKVQGESEMKIGQHFWERTLLGAAVLSCLTVIGGPSEWMTGLPGVGSSDSTGVFAAVQEREQPDQPEARGPREGDRPDRPEHPDRPDRAERPDRPAGPGREGERRDRPPHEREGERREPPPEARRAPGPPPEVVELRRKLEQRAAELREELARIGRERPDRAEQLERELREIRARLAELQQREPQRPIVAMERLRRHMAELREQLARAEHERAEGRIAELRQQIERVTAELERLEREAEQRRPRIEGRPEPGIPPVPPRVAQMPPEERERRIHHLEAAIEHLRAAGLMEQAAAVEMTLRRLRGEPVPPVMVPPAGPRPGAGPPRDLLGELQVLKQAIEELGAQVRELRDQMGQLRERISRD